MITYLLHFEPFIFDRNSFRNLERLTIAEIGMYKNPLGLPLIDNIMLSVETFMFSISCHSMVFVRSSISYSIFSTSFSSIVGLSYSVGISSFQFLFNIHFYLNPGRRQREFFFDNIHPAIRCQTVIYV